MRPWEEGPWRSPSSRCGLSWVFLRILGRALGHFIFPWLGLRGSYLLIFFKGFKKPHLGIVTHRQKSEKTGFRGLGGLGPRGQEWDWKPADNKRSSDRKRQELRSWLQVLFFVSDRTTPSCQYHPVENCCGSFLWVVGVVSLVHMLETGSKSK